MVQCRFCGTVLVETFVDLGTAPLANSYVKLEDNNSLEPFFPVHVYVCSNCLLVQLKECESALKIFSDYAYFSSYSKSWLDQSKRYVECVIDRFKLNKESQIVEIASNDGYLLQYFVEKGISALGIDPAANVAKIAEERKVPTIVKFFGTKLAKELLENGCQADLLIGNNVLAHVPDINDFVAGMKILLKQNGRITMEFPHLMNLINGNQFDTIYHEHFSYLSLYFVEQLFRKHGLYLFDVEELPSHGGSIRIFVTHIDSNIPESERLVDLRRREKEFGLYELKNYFSFGSKVAITKRKLLDFLIKTKNEGKTVVGYGAPAKGNSLLNYCGIRTDFLDYTVDASPHKQGLYLPGVRIPIYAPSKIMETKPDYILILPWNIREEIMNQMSKVREWGCKFIIAIPEVKIFS